MADSETPPLNDFIADGLGERADDLTHAWINQLGQRLGVRPARLVPAEELLDHIPELLRGVADFIRLPIESVKSEVIGHLRLLAELRREQGYDIEELLIEFEVLSKLMADCFVEVVRQYPDDADPVEVATISGRMREGLAAITAVTVGA